MSGIKHVVKKGDTLWDLSRRYLGDPLKWPRIYEYNNQPGSIQVTGSKIVDPDLIFVGQSILIPSNNPPSAQPRPVNPVPKPVVQQHTGKKKARDFRGVPIKYDLEDLPVSTVASPFHIMQIKLTGSLTVQKDNASDIFSMSPTQFFINSKTESDNILTKLVTQNEVSWNPVTRQVKFKNGISIHAKDLPIGDFTISNEVSSTTWLPVIKAEAKVPTIKGHVDGYTYVTSDFGIVIEITPIPPTAQPVPVKEPETSSGWDKILAVGLVVVATVVVVGTIVEDVVTAGAGTADDPASFAAAATMMYKAQRLWSKLPARNAIKMEAHGLKNVAPAF